MQDPTEVVTLTAHAYGGSAIGRLADGRAVFVPFALPGEQVRVRLVEQKRGHARAELVEVLQAAPQRITPRCVHFTVCGGCHYQHLAYADQLEVKRTVVRDQLQRIGGLADPDVRPVVPSPAEWVYRNNVQFHLSPRGRLGYLAAQSDRVIEIVECHLPEPDLNALWPQLDFEALPDLQRVGLRKGTGDDPLLTLESESLDLPELETDLEISIVHVSPGGALVMAGDDHVVFEMLGRMFQVSAESFFQVNTAVAERMVQHLLGVLPLTPETSLLELYCGAGLFSAFLAPRVRELVGIELSPSACADFAANLDEFAHVSLYQGAVEEVLPALGMRPQVVLADPPRAGLDRRAMDALLRLAPRTIAYVSCDPATLARDLKRLAAAGYRLLHATPFDLFPQTFHVETIAVVERIA